MWGLLDRTSEKRRNLNNLAKPINALESRETTDATLIGPIMDPQWTHAGARN